MVTLSGCTCTYTIVGKKRKTKKKSVKRRTASKRKTTKRKTKKRATGSRKTSFQKCVATKLKGKRYRNRTSQKQHFKKAVRACAKAT